MAKPVLLPVVFTLLALVAPSHTQCGQIINCKTCFLESGASGTNNAVCSGCKPGWFLYQNSCDQCGTTCVSPPNGTARCDPVTGSCYYGCQPNYHGSKCQRLCNLANCNTCTYNELFDNLTCAVCVAGRYGPYCTSCNSNCLRDTGEICLHNGGTCLEGCRPGYRGDNCNVACDKTIGMANCDQCDRYQFACTVCKPGFWGPQCQFTCGVNCVAVGGVCGARYCDITDGTCRNGCMPTYYKNDCSGFCPNCANNVCHRTAGTCLDPICDSGFYSATCNQTCPAGFFGTQCQSVCKVQCATGSCDRGSGTCSPCKTGYRGCFELQYSATNGDCKSKCVTGKYGTKCVSNCIETCNDGTCDQTTGKCEVACPRIEMQVDRTVFTFPATRIGGTGYSWERCYPENKALVTADCTGSYETGAKWRNILLSPSCGTVPQYNQSSSTSSLRNLSKTTMDETNYVDILRNIVNLTSPDVNVTEADVIYTADILSNFLDANLQINNTVLSSVLKIANNILLTDREAIKNAQKITNADNRIVKSVDDLTHRIELPPLIDRNNESASYVEDFIASQVWLQRGDGRVVIGIRVNSDSDRTIKPDSLTPLFNASGLQFNDVDAAIYLTENMVKGNLTKLAFHVYSRTHLFSDSSNRYVVQSSVAAARLNRNNREVRDLGNEFVTAVFHVAEPHANLVCAYWDYNANEAAGGWSTDGCNMTRDDDDDDGDLIVCKCNHLTNFAVLVDLKANSELSETDKLALGIITKVGLILSIIGLGLTIVTFLVFRHLRKGRGQQVLVNLSVSMLCSAILFLVGMDRTSSYGGCITVAVLLHYFILVSFMWMLVEGVLQYLRFVKVLGTYIPNFMMKSMIPAWGIPLIPVIVILAVDYDMYYGGKGYCWLSRNPMIFGFIIPVAVIIFANIIVFTMVMCNLLRQKNNTMASNKSERKIAFLHFQAAVSIFFILGLTWVFGFLTVDDTRIAFHYLFANFSAFQGLFVFLLFTAREKQIRNAWRKLCCGRSQYKATISGSEDARRKCSNGDINSTGLSKSDKGLDLSTKL